MLDQITERQFNEIVRRIAWMNNIDLDYVRQGVERVLRENDIRIKPTKHRKKQEEQKQIYSMLSKENILMQYHRQKQQQQYTGLSEYLIQRHEDINKILFAIPREIPRAEWTNKQSTPELAEYDYYRLEKYK